MSSASSDSFLSYAKKPNSRGQSLSVTSNGPNNMHTGTYRTATSTSTALASLSAHQSSQRMNSSSSKPLSPLDTFMIHHKPSTGRPDNAHMELNNDTDSHSSIVYTEEDSDADIQILVSRGYSRELAVIMHRQQVNELKELTRCGSQSSNQMSVSEAASTGKSLQSDRRRSANGLDISSPVTDIDELSEVSILMRRGFDREQAVALHRQQMLELSDTLARIRSPSSSRSSSISQQPFLTPQPQPSSSGHLPAYGQLPLPPANHMGSGSRVAAVAGTHRPKSLSVTFHDGSLPFSQKWPASHHPVQDSQSSLSASSSSSQDRLTHMDYGPPQSFHGPYPSRPLMHSPPPQPITPRGSLTSHGRPGSSSVDYSAYYGHLHSELIQHLSYEDELEVARLMQQGYARWQAVEAVRGMRYSATGADTASAVFSQLEEHPLDVTNNYRLDSSSSSASLLLCRFPKSHFKVTSGQSWLLKEVRAMFPQCSNMHNFVS